MKSTQTERPEIMSKFVVTTFGSEANAYEGTRALKELHAEGNLTLYGMAVITKDAGGKLSVKEGSDALPGTRSVVWSVCWSGSSAGRLALLSA